MIKDGEKFSNYEVQESNKLLGVQNYYIQKIKISTILKTKNLWSIVETKKLVSSFLANIQHRSYIEIQLAKAKQRAQSGLTMIIIDSLIDTLF